MRQERSFSCQPLSRHQHCALALPVQKQFGVTLTEVEWWLPGDEVGSGELCFMGTEI